jgi:diguanylate cyclase (GGDEF)-like protein
MIDVDFFKGINDQFGHDTGDICLQRISAHLESRLSIEQPLFRYGGEEFIVLTNNPLNQAAILAEELRSHIETTQLIREQMITVSIGVTELVAGDTARGALNRVDEALYEAKRAGRNRVCIAPLFARCRLELYA